MAASTTSMSRRGPIHQDEQGQQQQYRTLMKLHGVGLRYINGVASCYAVPRSSHGGGGGFPSAALAERGVSQAAFQGAVDRVNSILLMYWPCVPCFVFGYMCSPCTLGLSLGGPGLCVAEAEKYMRFEMDCLNGSALFRAAGMRWELRKTCLRSWIEVQLSEEQRGEQQEQQEQGE